MINTHDSFICLNFSMINYFWSSIDNIVWIMPTLSSPYRCIHFYIDDYLFIYTIYNIRHHFTTTHYQWLSFRLCLPRWKKNHFSSANEASFWIKLSEEVLTFKGLCDRWKQKADHYELPFNYWTLVQKWDKCARACRTHCTFVPFQTWKETKSYVYILFRA